MLRSEKQSKTDGCQGWNARSNLQVMSLEVNMHEVRSG